MALGRGDTFGRYVVEAVLGAGGGGEVYQAHDTILKRPVALKVLLPNALDTEQGAVRARVLREARAAAQLNHPNVVAIFDVGEHEGVAYMAMELVPGRSLRAYVGAPDVSVERRLRWLCDVALALDAAHKAGLIHRDVKPENVIVRDDGFIKVVDFGIARHTAVDAAGPTDTRNTGSASAGTPHYMAPEQIRSLPLDARVDQFGWGVTAYELLSGGDLPWDSSAGTLSYVASVLAEDPVPLRDRDERIPAEVASLVERALRRSPEQRFATIAEIADALEPLRNRSGPDVVRHVISVQPPPRDLGHEVTTKAPVSGRQAHEETPRRADPPGRANVGRGLRRRAVVLALVAVVGIGGALVYFAQRANWVQSRRTALAGGSASANVPAPSATTLLDLPPPVSTVPEALTEYRAGLQLQRDDTFGRALDHFRRAAELDPGMAEAQIRVAITGWEVDAHPTEIRAALAKAVALRGRLADRDRALLDALEPIMGRSEPDEAAAIDRLQAAHERFPLDEEFLVILAELTIGDTVRGSAFARRATELDPSDGYAWEELGRGLALRGDVEGGRHALEQCAAVSVESTDCHFWLALLDRDDGRCAEMERKARRLADLDPAGYELLAQALVALGRSETSVRESVARSLASKPAARRAILQSAHDAKLAILGGRFDVAARLLSDAADGLAASPEGRSDLMNGPVAGLRIHVLAEAGSDSAARTVAREFSHRFDFPDETGRRNTYGSDLWTLRVASLPLDPRRRQWVDGQLRSGASGSGVWVLGWARPTVTAEDAKEALAALEGDARLALPRGGEAMIPLREGADAPAGHVLLLAGKAADALPYLQRASQSCDTFVEPLAHVHAQLDLGHALEALGDEPGACAAYGLVLDRWGSAKPRSVTADEARKRTQALRCETRDR